VLFPGYVFVRLDMQSDQWLGARSAPGVAYFLGSAGMPSPLPDELIDGIRLRTGQSDGVAWLPEYSAGESVVIKNGPFAGLEAVFDSCLTGRGRVRVLLELVQRLVPVDLDVSQLARAS
jgi:transcription antitermination factor NusG